MTVRVLLADDQQMVRMGFAMILAQAPDIEVVAQCADGVEAVTAIREHRPDVSLLDIRMPRLDGLSVLARVATLTKVVMVTTFDDETYVDRALEGGASGFLLKDSGPELLVAAVRAAAAGDALISPEVTVDLLRRRRQSSARDPGLEALSEREREVAVLVARGLTNAEIAAELYLSLGTVKSHLASVQRRLEVRNRVEIAARVWRAGLGG